MTQTIYRLPQNITNYLETCAKQENLKKIAEAILNLSDFYTAEEGKSSPWDQPSMEKAYFYYFFPLNLLRSYRVCENAEFLNFFSGIQSIEDFGSGLGSASWPLLELHLPVQNFEKSIKAIQLHRKILADIRGSAVGDQIRWHQMDQFKTTGESVGLLKMMSYSLNELPIEDSLMWLENAEAVLLIEPSTQLAGRNLQMLRAALLNKGFHAWAPCTHQMECPMLLHSKTDWCHDRMRVELPNYFEDLEKHLPIRNRTLTFSYLLMRKTPPEKQLHRVRVVSDQLEEKGKTRSMICRNSNREWLSWLHRQGPAPDLDRGSLIEWEGTAEVKGQELRLDPTGKFQRLLPKY